MAVTQHWRAIDTWLSQPHHGGHIERTPLSVAIEQWHNTADGPTGGDGPSIEMPDGLAVMPNDATRIAAALDRAVMILTAAKDPEPDPFPVKAGSPWPERWAKLSHWWRETMDHPTLNDVFMDTEHFRRWKITHPDLRPATFKGKA